jgi:hypothetical protein
MFIDVSEGLVQCLLGYSGDATLFMTATIDANALDTAANNLGKFRRARVAPILAVCTLGEIRSHQLQCVIESGWCHHRLRPATARDA